MQIMFEQFYTLQRDLFVQIEYNMSMSIFMGAGANPFHFNAA